MSTLPRLSVLLPTYRQPDALLQTVRDLNGQTYPSELWELVIIDDGSRDNSAAFALLAVSSSTRITLERRPAGGRYSHAALFNELIRLADLNTDAFIHVEDARLQPDYLQQHAKWHTGREKRLVTGPMCEGDSETFEPEACSRWKLMTMSGARSVAYRCCFQAIFAKSMSYPRALVSELVDSGGGAPFDASMSGWGYQEIEFAFRAEQSGAVCIYDSMCAVYHPRHVLRDERDYRGIDRGAELAQGTEENVKYLCEKHQLAGLPGWRVGEPIESPS